MDLAPSLEGRIDRRLLVNLRVAPDAAAAVLPPGMRPLVVNGSAVAGMCLIRLAGLRPSGLAGTRGVATENMAHRIAVEWDDGGRRRTGVWIPRRHSSSRLTVLLGGRLFPAPHAHARFTVRDSPAGVEIDVVGGEGHVASVRVAPSTEVPVSSVFGSVAEADEFFRRGATGVSAARRGATCDVVELEAPDWELQPMAIADTHSAMFEDHWSLGTDAEWDSAFIMRGVACRWLGAGSWASSTERRSMRVSSAR